MSSEGPIPVDHAATPSTLSSVLSLPKYKLDRETSDLFAYFASCGEQCQSLISTRTLKYQIRDLSTCLILKDGDRALWAATGPMWAWSFLGVPLDVAASDVFKSGPARCMHQPPSQDTSETRLLLRTKYMTW